MEDIKLTITNPSGDHPLIDYLRDFDVQGTIEHEGVLDDDLLLIVKLLDKDNNVVRYSKQNRKNNTNLYLDHPKLITYKEEIDPGKEKLKQFGFPELLVKDLNNPEASLHDATIKCFYNDNYFKAIIVSATDTKHGRIMNTGLYLCDENGNPYYSLDKGEYTISVELYDKNNTLLANTSKPITINSRTSQTILRFNPVSHLKRMVKWCIDNGFTVTTDTLTGYLEPYTGKWYYHMGLLPYYRSNDIAFYLEAKVSMFVYLIDSDSTSYETELAYLQSNNRVGNPDMFKAYHYDIGEAILGKDKAYEKEAEIIEFDDNNLYLYRIDIVNDKASENCFNLNEEAIEDIIYDTSEINISSNTTIAISGVVKPWQLDPNDFILTEDNIYKIRNSVDNVVYEFTDGINTYTENRKLMMERIDDYSIGHSVFEFYNLFTFDESYKGKRLTVKITVTDRNNVANNSSRELIININ